MISKYRNQQIAIVSRAMRRHPRLRNLDTQIAADIAADILDDLDKHRKHLVQNATLR